MTKKITCNCHGPHSLDGFTPAKKNVIIRAHNELHRLQVKPEGMTEEEHFNLRKSLNLRMAEPLMARERRQKQATRRRRIIGRIFGSAAAGGL